MKTEIIVITDRSGSMAPIAGDCDGGFRKFIEDQKTVPGEARVTMVKFDHVVETEYQAIPLREVKDLNLVARGTTALNDAIGMTLNAQAKRIHDEAWADLVIVVVITDGFENASREYQRERVAEMIEHARKAGWRFVFLAANQDAVLTATHYGMEQALAANFVPNAAGASAAYATATLSVRNLRTGK